jgi:hypothetical protein
MAGPTILALVWFGCSIAVIAFVAGVACGYAMKPVRPVQHDPYDDAFGG